MNPQQLRQIIDQQMQIGLALANSDADSLPEVSLAATTRRIAMLLQSQRHSVAAPLQPLPSAECMAAFAEQQTTELEEQQVVAACIHDMGILFQLVNIVDQKLNNVSLPPSNEVMAGLLALAPQAVHPSRETHLIEAQFIEAPPIKAQLVESQLAPGQLTRLNSSSQVELSATPQTNGHRSALLQNRRSSIQWRLAVGAMVAATALLAIFSAGYLMTNNAKPNQNQLGAAQKNQAQPSMIDAVKSPNAVELAEIPSTEVQPNNAQLARETHQPPQPKLDSPEIAAAEPLEKLPSNSLPAPPMPEVKPTPMEVPPQFASAKFGRWEQVSGIVAASQSRESPNWQAVSQADGKELVDENQPLSWMTPPGCYAQAAFGAQGKLILRENSLATFRTQTKDSDVLPVCELEYGAVYVSNALANHLLQIDTTSNISLQLELAESASLIAWVEGSELRLLPQGNVTADGQMLVSGKVIQVAQDHIEPIELLMELPEWCQQLPKESVLSRAILGNLDQSTNLAQAIDHQLIGLLSRQSTPQSLKLIQQLSQWRVAMDSDYPLRAALSPITPVRLVALNSILSDTTEERFVAARRSLLGRLQPPGEDRRRLQMLRMQLKPSRQDVAAWLNELTGDDPELAALADYMFRSQAATGPNFDPTAPRAQRELVKRAWLKLYTGQLTRPNAPASAIRNVP